MHTNILLFIKRDKIEILKCILNIFFHNHRTDRSCKKHTVCSLKTANKKLLINSLTVYETLHQRVYLFLNYSMDIWGTKNITSTEHWANKFKWPDAHRTKFNLIEYGF